jgi:hypothetical protein
MIEKEQVRELIERLFKANSTLRNCSIHVMTRAADEAVEISYHLGILETDEDLQSHE